jgi:flagellar hook-associated protein 1 FlgK
MPISSFTGLETARRGLLAQQRAIEVSGHNIANQATPGYTRQRAELTASPALSLVLGAGSAPVAQLGTGANLTGIGRIRDQFADVQYRAQVTRLGDVSTRGELLGQAETAFAEPGANGLSAAIDKVWRAWSDLANDPTSLPARQVVLDATRTVADAYAQLDSQLAAVQQHAGEEYAALTAEGGPIHLAAKELADLNDAIGAAYARGDDPNDLLDRRDLVLDQLAEYGQVQVQQTLDGGGQPVKGKIDVLLGSDPTPIVSGGASREPWALAFAASGPGTGKLGALAGIASAGGSVDQYRQALASSAQALASSINALHQGAGGPAILVSATGPITPGVARRPLDVDAAIDPAQGGSLSAFVAGSAPGLNDVATKIGALAGSAGPQQYQALVGKIGGDVAAVTREESTVRALTTALADRRDAVSGVSLDEEMADLIRFQRGYQASARMLSTVDEMLDQLINRTGRVGL